MPANGCLGNDYIPVLITFAFKLVAIETKRDSYIIHHPFVIGTRVPPLQVFGKEDETAGIRAPFPFLAPAGIVAGISLYLPAGLWDKDAVPRSLAIQLRKTGMFCFVVHSISLFLRRNNKPAFVLATAGKP